LALRQQAELIDMQRLNESLLKALPIPVFYKDVEGRFISCNPTFTQITGISKAELLGKRVDEILLEARILTVADIVESMSSDRPYRAALGIPQARDHIIRMRGAQLDEAVVDACLRILDRGDFTPHELGHGQP
jgi:PAS domain-containing protein